MRQTPERRSLSARQCGRAADRRTRHVVRSFLVNVGLGP